MRLYLVAVALLASTVFVNGGCVGTDEDTVVFIMHNQAVGLGDCVIEPSLESPFLARGSIATNSPNGYVLAPILLNNATSSNTDVNQTYFVEGADVTLTPQSGFFVGAAVDALNAANQLSFSQRFSAFVAGDGGLTAVSFEILQKGFLDAVGTLDPGTVLQVKAELQIFGQFHGGGLKSQKFVYWIDVCSDCNQVVDVGACDELPAGFAARQGSCFGLQDAPVDCCSSGTTVVCPATVPSGG